MSSLYTPFDVFDAHEWVRDVRADAISWRSGMAGMTCAACGIKRYVSCTPDDCRPLAYNHPNIAEPHWLIPYCRAAVIRLDEVIVDFKACVVCQHVIEGEACRNGSHRGAVVLRALCRRKT